MQKESVNDCRLVDLTIFDVFLSLDGTRWRRNCVVKHAGIKFVVIRGIENVFSLDELNQVRIIGFDVSWILN